ncbi:SMP-30/gluconolactonase/LRE family protein [Novosphingobium kaempferiae]|uniref:SMP-30/gluconolactonase/LRE family protein n=1 Tax=Novosphingobium kaempferiae TaxID=2896849 RepID=UPI001E4C4F03|nr:SMP-30/gluconolactonase/LRE family protein [Novosphingobium kaempferiae]
METTVTDRFEVVVEGYQFIEAPRVSPEGDIWFSDLTGTGVHRKRAGHAAETMLPGRQWVGGIVFDESGMVLCSGRDGIAALDPATGKTRAILPEIEGSPVIAVNDMEADGWGGLFAGTIDFASIFETGGAPGPGTLFHMSAAGEVTVLRRDVIASNGFALSPCGKWLYHSETLRGIWRYPLDGAGRPGEGEVLIEMDDSDGMVADVEGNLWVAGWRTGKLVQFSAQGDLLRSLSFPYPHIVSLDFGADDPSALYIATGGNAENRGKGAILRMPVEIPGLAGARTRLDLLRSLSI